MSGFGIIAGTGFCDLFLEPSASQSVSTPYGTATVETLALEGREVLFLARHARGHTMPPHRINYRANIAALKQLGVTSILATATVGSMNPALPPSSLVLLTQFLDFTRSRASTFFDGEDGRVVHTDVTEPYCPRLRQTLASAASKIGLPLQPSATYACMEGPRFETPAEIKMLDSLGANIVGMTNVPEVVLAREAGICYAAVGLITNWAAGLAGAPLSHQEVVAVGGRNLSRVKALFEAAISLHEDTDCSCRHVSEPM